MKNLRTLKDKLDKRFYTLLAMLTAAAMPLFAADDAMPAEMKTLASKIYGTMTGMTVKIILACFLAGSAVAYAFNKDNEKVKRNCIAIGIGAGILMAATSIIGLITGETISVQ